MKKIILSVAVSLFAASLAPAAFAATTQQNKMKECNASAADKKGDERKAFMKDCLSAKPAAAPKDGKTTQQDKMKSCNKEAGDKALKGDERKKFMSSCLKG
ncbi:PsiF family protein [Zoogloea sp. LCSB751]|uniref:PsiF family protein n=1 Tax=Zoogloea sp. LCSB751 TaxID=1965277 RepID=UPI0009A54A86|nr:PsiF family protein [Zoogloea sp. LCSB751]